MALISSKRVPWESKTPISRDGIRPQEKWGFLCFRWFKRPETGGLNGEGDGPLFRESERIAPVGKYLIGVDGHTRGDPIPRPDHSAGGQTNTILQNTSMVYNGTAVHDAPGMELGIGADNGLGKNDTASPQMYRRADIGRGMDEGRHGDSRMAQPVQPLQTHGIVSEGRICYRIGQAEFRKLGTRSQNIGPTPKVIQKLDLVEFSGLGGQIGNDMTEAAGTDDEQIHGSCPLSLRVSITK